jgi:hypothetical protein
MKKYTKQEIKAYAKSVTEETGEACSYEQAALYLEQQAAHDAEAEAGTGDKYEFGLPVRTETVQPETKAETLKVKAGLKFRGARQAWYEALLAYDGKPAAEFLAHVEATRPSKYGAKSKHAGTPEPVAGWFRFFVRTGVATLV